MALFSPQSTPERVLSPSGSAAWGTGGGQAPAYPLPAGPNSLLSPLHCSHNMYRGLKYAGFFFKKKKSHSPLSALCPQFRWKYIVEIMFCIFYFFVVPSSLPSSPPACSHPAIASEGSVRIPAGTLPRRGAHHREGSFTSTGEEVLWCLME